VLWSDAPPSTDLPITKSVVLQHPGCQLCSSYHSCSYKNFGSWSLSDNLESGDTGGDTLLYSNLKVIAVPFLATISHTAPLTIQYRRGECAFWALLIKTDLKVGKQ